MGAFAVAIMGVFLLSLAIIVFGIDLWNWSKTGSFEMTSLWNFWSSSGFAEPYFDSQLLQAIVRAALHFPISIILAVAGIAALARRKI
jgi:hypothetical protein